MGGDTEIRSGDLIRDEYQIRYYGSDFVVRRSGDRIEFFVPKFLDRPIGCIRFGSQWSGAVWLGNNVIGEYEQRGQQWFVTPIDGGLKNPDAIQQIHPTNYLLATIIHEGSLPLGTVAT